MLDTYNKGQLKHLLYTFYLELDDKSKKPKWELDFKKLTITKITSKEEKRRENTAKLKISDEDFKKAFIDYKHIDSLRKTGLEFTIDKESERIQQMEQLFEILFGYKPDVRIEIKDVLMKNEFEGDTRAEFVDKDTD